MIKNIFTVYTKIYLHYTYIHRPIYKQSRRPWTEFNQEQIGWEGALAQL